MISKKYSAALKLSLVEEYVKRSAEDPKLTKTNFAIEKGIPDSTFFSWINTYLRSPKGFLNVTGEIQKLENRDYEIVNSEPVTVKESESNITELKSNMIRVYCRGVYIDINENLLDKVMEIIKSW